MGLEIEFEYDDTPEAAWSPAQDTGPVRDWRDRLRFAAPPAGNPLLVQLGIALTAITLGAASMTGFLAGRTAVNDRTIALLHLAPVNPFVVQALPARQTQNTEPLLATPWTNAFDQDVSLSVINDSPDPVTVLGADLSALEFESTGLTPASTAPTAQGGVSLLRGRAHFVCGDFPPDRTATVAQVRARSADGVIHQETLVVDRFSQIAEHAVCARAPTPQVVRSTTFAPAPSHAPGAYVVNFTAANRTPFPLRMDLPQAAIETWSGGGGLELASAGDTVIPPHGTGTIAISVKVTDCPTAQQATSDGFAFDTLDFSDGRDPAGFARARLINQAVVITDLSAIMAYCLAHTPTPGGG